MHRDTLRGYIRKIIILSEAPAVWKTYYNIDDPQNPPSIEEISRRWVENLEHPYDSSINWRRPAMYDPKDLVPYREFDRSRLRGGEKYLQGLKQDIIENGIREPIIIVFGKNGITKMGEGNHRHEIAMELGIPKVPVRYMFYEETFMTPLPKPKKERKERVEDIEPAQSKPTRSSQPATDEEIDAILAML